MFHTTRPGYKTSRISQTLVIAASVSLLSLGLVACRGNSDIDLTKSAREYIEKKDHRSAIIQLKNTLRENPESAEARLLLGRALLLSGDASAAMVELRKAQELKATDEKVLPEMARAMLALAEESKVIEQFGTMRLKDPEATADLLTSVAIAHGLKRDNAKATEAASAALLVKPAYVPATVVLAQIKATDNQFDAAIALLDTALVASPGDESASVLRAELIWRGKKDAAGAMAAYRKVLEKTPASLGAHTALITLLNLEGKKEESTAQFAAMKKALPNHPETLFYEAQVLFGAQDFKGAITIIDQLLRGLPESARLLELGGATNYRLGNYSAAETMLSRALKNAPGMVLSRQMLAQTHLRNNQAGKALETLQPLLSTKEPEASSLAIAGEAHLMLGDAKASNAAFEAATKIDPNNTRVRTAAAAALATQGNSAALGDLEKIAAGDTGPRADLALISARMRAGDGAGALKAIDALEKKMPDRAMPLGLRGQVQLGQRDMAAARKSFEAALAKEPAYFPAVVSLAGIEQSEGKVDLARKRFDDFIKANPASHQALLSLADLNSRTGAPAAEVTRLVREAVRVSPQEPQPRMTLIEQLISTNDTKAAVVLAQESVVIMPSSLEMLESLGRAQLAAGDAQQAISSFKKVAALQPNNPRLQVRLAEAFLMRKDSPAAIQALNRALEINPGFMPAKRGLVTLAILDKRYADGLAVAKDLQKNFPKEAVGFLYEGEVELSRKGFEPAIAAYTQALQRIKSTENAIKLHNAVLSSGKKAEADRMAAEWQKEYTTDAGYRFYLADMAMARNEDAAAEALYRNVLTLQPNNALAINNVAWLMVKQGKPGATAMAEKAVALLVDRAPLLDTLAGAQAAENQLPKAVETQKRAISLDPENPMLKLSLARIYIKQGEKAYARDELERLGKLGDKFPAQAEVTQLLKTL
jgi:cellulose synthase operon protein C